MTDRIWCKTLSSATRKLCGDGFVVLSFITLRIAKCQNSFGGDHNIQLGLSNLRVFEDGDRSLFVLLQQCMFSRQETFTFSQM